MMQNKSSVQFILHMFLDNINSGIQCLSLNVDGLYDFYTESDKNVDGSIKALKNVTGIGKNSKVFSIFDKYGTKTVKTIEDVVGLIGG